MSIGVKVELMSTGDIPVLLAKELKELGLSQSDLARKSGISTGSISRWLSGSGSINEINCLKLARVLGVEPIEFLGAANHDEFAKVLAGFLPKEKQFLTVFDLYGSGEAALLHKALDRLIADGRVEEAQGSIRRLQLSDVSYLKLVEICNDSGSEGGYVFFSETEDPGFPIIWHGVSEDEEGMAFPVTWHSVSEDDIWKAQPKGEWFQFIPDELQERNWRISLHLKSLSRWTKNSHLRASLYSRDWAKKVVSELKGSRSAGLIPEVLSFAEGSSETESRVVEFPREAEEQQKGEPQSTSPPVFLGTTTIKESDHDEPRPVHVMKVPYFADRVPAGPPDEVESDGYRMVEIMRHLHKASRYAICAFGNSMEPEIRSGDLLLVDYEQEAHSKDIICALLNGGSQIKQLIRRGRGVYLRSFNEEYKEHRITPEDELKIQGVVIRVVDRVPRKL